MEYKLCDHMRYDAHAVTAVIHLQNFVCSEGLQAVLDGGGDALPTQPGPQAPFAFLHNRQGQVPEGLIGCEVAFALVAVHCALQLTPEQVGDGAIVNAQVLAPQPLRFIFLCFSREILVLFIAWLGCDTILHCK